MDPAHRPLTIRSRSETPLGCRVDRATRVDPVTRSRVEEVVLSHPEPIEQVAFSALRLRRRTLLNPGRA